MFGVPSWRHGGVSPPLAPYNIVLADNGEIGQFTVNWTDGFDGGMDITSYKIKVYNGDAVIGEIPAGLNQKPYTVTTVAGGTVCSVTVTAINDIGEGFESERSSEWHVSQAVAKYNTGENFTAPSTKVYKFYIVGGGGGGSSSGGTSGYGGGGSSGYYSEAEFLMNKNDVATISIGAGGIGQSNGGITSVTVKGQTITANGGIFGTKSKAGRDGGSGSGNGGYGDPVKAGGNGGRWGTNGEATGGSYQGKGQLGLPYGQYAASGNSKIPSGGSGSYFVSAVSYEGIFGFGAGNAGSQNQNASGKGCGAGGCGWQQPARNGGNGMVVILG